MNRIKELMSILFYACCIGIFLPIIVWMIIQAKLEAVEEIMR